METVKTETAALLRPRLRLIFRIWLVVCTVGGLLSISNAHDAALGAPSAGPDEEIVYIDDTGVIRVLDTHQVGDRPTVTWYSPEGEWRAFGLGDFNNDGDYEIVAVGGEDFAGKLAVYDPVVVTDGDSKPHINGIPWDTLYETTFDGRPDLAATGDFDAGIAGHEIVYGFELNDNDKQATGDNYRLVVLKAENTSAPDGRGWTVSHGRDSEEIWSRIAVGNLDGQTPDDMAIVDEDQGILHVLRIDGGNLVSILEHDDVNTPWWRDVAIGQYVAGGAEELAAVRYSTPNLANAWVMQYDASDGNFNDIYFETFNPSPRVTFMADVNGSGDDEWFMLRHVNADNAPNSPRLFMRNDGDDEAIDFEVVLDADNLYRGGAAGDVDGDGKDEVVVIRNSQLTVFSEPDVSVASTDHVTTTNRRDVALVDLDLNGFDANALLSASPNPLNVTRSLGDASATFDLSVINAGTGNEFDFSASVVAGAEWAKMADVNTTTPASLTIEIAIDGLFPGNYSGEILVTSSDSQVVNQPFRIPIALTVRADVLTDPLSPRFVFYPCASATLSQTQQVSVVSAAGTGTHFDVEEDAAWLTVSPTSGQTPATIELTVDPTQRSTDRDEATLTINGFDTGGNTVVKGLSKVELICAEGLAFLPLIMNEEPVSAAD